MSGEELRRQCGLAEELPPDPDLLQIQLPFVLQRAAERHPVILVLDALNQLDPVKSSDEIGWFPFLVPAGARVIASAVRGVCLDRLRSRVDKNHIADVPPLSLDDCR